MRRYFGTDNIANYSNSEAEDILREIYNITDEKTLKEKYKKLQNIYEDERPYIGLYCDRITLILGKNLITTGTSNWFNIFSDIENWHKKN